MMFELSRSTSSVAHFIVSGAFAAAGIIGSYEPVMAAVPHVRGEFVESTVRPVRLPVTNPTHYVVDFAAEATSTVVEQSGEKQLLQSDDWTSFIYGSDLWRAAHDQLEKAILYDDGWDGPLSKGPHIITICHAETLLWALEEAAPDGPVPMVGVDEDGVVVLTWRDGLVAGSGSVFDDGTFAYYVERDGMSASDGEFVISQTPPPQLLNILIGVA